MESWSWLYNNEYFAQCFLSASNLSLHPHREC